MTHSPPSDVSLPALSDLRQAGRYRVVYADPPWAFETWSHRGQGKGASQHYATQGLDWLKSLPISDLAAPNAALFLWVVQPLFPQALDLIRAWGFEYKTVGYIWIKCKTPPGEMLFWDEAFAQGLARKGLGYHTRSGSEQCWIATRGKGYERLSKGEAQVVHAPLRAHSQKPDEIADSICRLAKGPRAELFARTTRPGFDAWGNETTKFDPSHRCTPVGGPRYPGAGGEDMDSAGTFDDEELPETRALACEAASRPDDCVAANRSRESAAASPVSCSNSSSEDDLLEIPRFLKRGPDGRLLYPRDDAPVGRVFP
jgi:N6-adenosine-specific RNA methylase IME4